MADNVIIDQINWNSDLPKWATESTQAEIAKQLGANLKELKKQGEDDKKKGKTEAKANKDTTTILEKGFKSMRQAAGKQTEAFNKFSEINKQYDLIVFLDVLEHIQDMKYF